MDIREIAIENQITAADISDGLGVPLTTAQSWMREEGSDAKRTPSLAAQYALRIWFDERGITIPESAAA